MTQPAKSQEPSMEEILASIRRIIADDDASKSSQRNAEPPKPAAAPPPVPAAPSAAASRVAPPEPNLTDFEPKRSPAVFDSGPVGDADAAQPSPDILDLTESMASALPDPAPAMPDSMPETVPQFRTIAGGSDVGFDDAVDNSQGSEPEADERAQLLSSQARVAVDSAFNSLAQTVLVQNARTLEDLVREMLRPLLKAWLDDNLPGVVERLVRAEIERVSRGRMG
jgi:uncharacterized protein